MGMQRFLVVFFYLAYVWSSLVEAAPLRRTGPKFVYRGAGRSPEDVKAAGGFLPKGVTTIGTVTPDVSIYNHVRVADKVDEDGNNLGAGATPENSGYVSTTSSFLLALGYAFYYREQETTWIYKIKTTPNMISARKTLGKYNDDYREEDEYSALGGIKFDQIVSWSKVDRNNLVNFSWLWSTKNIDYSETRYRGFRTGGAQYQLAGFPADHQAWNEEPWSRYKPCSGESEAVCLSNLKGLRT
ncbi:Heat-labile enterotoxin A chain [Colletotrichum trifolii]|uniref:Heat-labile enterotoxin A chain n=1 Tax=Colletotrichum trifolii TaxID=5466 RepID=A0A4R8R5R3_COLTR|nr:Heat-labile enterotoxin A chain [Colletotrichum trifolii]